MFHFLSLLIVLWKNSNKKNSSFRVRNYGLRIACHLINVGFEVVLLDITPKELNKTELKNNKKLNDLEVRNRIVNESLSNAVHSKPSPLFKKEKHTKIITGNFEDDIKLVSTVDWIIEVVVENLKKKMKSMI